MMPPQATPGNMKSVVIDQFVKDYEDIRVSDVALPPIKEDEIQIRVKAAGVNFVDTLYARGIHQNNKRHVKPPFTLGLEFAGEIQSAPSSSHFKPGDRVFGDWLGSYSTTIAVPVTYQLYHIPKGWTFAEAAGMAATLPVSYGALVLAGGLGVAKVQGQDGLWGDTQMRRMTILVHAAAGGLGIAAVQIAAALGHRVVGTAGSEIKCRVAEKLGAEVCIDYRQDEKWWERVNELTGGHGADLVYDTVGLVGDSLRCLAHRGKVLVVGFAGREGNMEGVKMNRILLKQASLIGYRFGESARRYPKEKAQIWKDLYPLLESGKIQAAVYDQQYRGLGSVPRALEDIASRKVWGKAVIRIDESDESSRPSRPRL